MGLNWNSGTLRMDPDLQTRIQNTFNRLIKNIVYCKWSYEMKQTILFQPWVIKTNVVDRHRFVADLGTTFLFDANQDPDLDSTKFYTCWKILNFIYFY